MALCGTGEYPEWLMSGRPSSLHPREGIVTTHLPLITVLALTAVACGGRRATELRTSEYPIGTRWNATLASPAAIPGGRYPWHVHRGQCGSSGDILGPADSYGILQVGKDGQASRWVTLPLPGPEPGPTWSTFMRRPTISTPSSPAAILPHRCAESVASVEFVSEFAIQQSVLGGGERS